MVSAQVRLALQAMRYYRLWIYASNLVLMAGVVIFASVAAALLSDPRRQLLPTAAVSPHQPSVVYAYAALVLQGAVLPVVGCLGALRLSEKLLNSYWILLLVLLAGDLLVGLVWIFRFQKLVAGLVPDLKHRLSLDYGTDADFDAAWDLLQRSARCCGVESPADFNNSLWLANLADRPAWQPPVISNRVQLSSSSSPSSSNQPPHHQPWRPLSPPPLIGDQRVSRLPLPDSCCKSASFNSDQLRSIGFMSMANEVPPGRKEVYGTGKHRQQLRDYNERYHERMMREQLHLQQQQQQQLASNTTLNRPVHPVLGPARYQRRATTHSPPTTPATTAATHPASSATSPKTSPPPTSPFHRVKDGQQQHRHRNQQHQRHREPAAAVFKEAVDFLSDSEEEECGGVWPSVGDVSDVHETGCAEFVLSWLHMTGDTLFVLGYCVLAFVKLCFLAILRYELREMVAKIKILQSEMAMNSTAGPIASSGIMPFTHCEMSGIRAVMARSAVPVPPALVATDVTNEDLHDDHHDEQDDDDHDHQHDDHDTPDLMASQTTSNSAAGNLIAAHQQHHQQQQQQQQQQLQHHRSSIIIPNGEVPSGPASSGGGLPGGNSNSAGNGGKSLQLPRPRRQSSFSEYNLVHPFVQQCQAIDSDLFSPPDTPVHVTHQHRGSSVQQHNDNGADSDSGSHCALLPSSCTSTGLPQRRVIKEWDPTESPPSSSPSHAWLMQPIQMTPPPSSQQHENGWPARPNGNNNEYHELREIKQTQI